MADPDLLGGSGPTRVAYLADTLAALSQDMGGRLVIRVGDPARILVDLARESGATSVFATEDFAPAGRSRDERVREALAVHEIGLELVDTPYAVRPGTVTTKAGTPSKVFTPFRRVWDTVPLAEPLAAPTDVEWLSAESESLEVLSTLAGTRRPWYFDDERDGVAHYDARVGEAGAARILEEFLSRVTVYDETRNLPGLAGTSGLSAHLRFGTIHPRQVLAAIPPTSRGAEVFRSEVAWREFYADVLFHHPESTWRVLQPSMEHLRVDTDAAAIERFHAWARGRTGYPLVDAGMRQLLAEGWMHNRVRMVCASFLVKHLHLDWRWGAKWLIDGDVASNQPGWQWTAGTGTDAAPFHRVFNPTLQAERFDPEGAYVRRYVRELSDITAPACLAPGGGEGLLGAPGYVAPIVDAARERDEALARFAEARELATAAGAS